MTLIHETNHHATPIALMPVAAYGDWLTQQSEFARNYLVATGFKASYGAQALVPSVDGKLAAVLVLADDTDLYALSKLARTLPAGPYQLANQAQEDSVQLLLGFALGGYQFNKYLPKKVAPKVELIVGNAAIRFDALHLAGAVKSARDMVNTPTEDMGPEHLLERIDAIAKAQGGRVSDVSGDALLQQNFPAIHAVGRASHRAPRLIELNWGNDQHPRVVLVGKGVCFDTGGLDMKAADGMALMKKDMGGAAVAIALAELVMAMQLPVRLKLLVPAVENAIGPNAYRPGEVIATRAGLRVEIGNTDAEGRVILCDALTYGAEFQPELMLDFATLTGAARIALGADLPAMFCHDDALAQELLACARQVQDPLWRMPLWQDYQSMIDSPIADINNAGSSRLAGAITAALYLDRFVPKNLAWVHIDTYCWNDMERPGRGKGGDCQSLRACFAYLLARYGDL
jgi:leucyl aminopeptidase